MSWEPGVPISIGAELDWHLHGDRRSLRPIRNTSNLPQLAHVTWLPPMAPVRGLVDDLGQWWFSLITPDGAIHAEPSDHQEGGHSK